MSLIKELLIDSDKTSKMGMNVLKSDWQHSVTLIQLIELFNECLNLVFVFHNGDVLFINKVKDKIPNLGKMSFMVLTYGVNTPPHGWAMDESEFFGMSQNALAMSCFLQRLQSHIPKKLTGLGSTLETIQANKL